MPRIPEKYKIGVSYHIPRPPNFIRLVGGGTVDVADLEDKFLRQLCRAMNKSLMKNAAQRRAQRLERAPARREEER